MKEYVQNPENCMPVRCISPRNGVSGQVRVGEAYLIDRMSVWMDCDGDAYGIVYDTNGIRIGQMKLCHFSSV